MSRINFSSTLDQFIARVERVRGALMPTVAAEVVRTGQEVQEQLGSHAPVGTGENTQPPAGDGPGKLSESFVLEQESDAASVHVTVSTTQPLKLLFVTQGTGLYGPLNHLIVPTKMKALYWPGAAHPVRSVRGMAANDFVTPVVASGNAAVGERIEATLSELAASM